MLLPNGRSQTSTSGAPSTVADVLVAQGVLQASQMEQIKSQVLRTGKTEEEILSTSGLVSEDQLARAKAQFYNISFIDLEQTPVSPEALAILPQSVAQRFLVVPVSVARDKKTLNLAMANPLDLSAIQFVEQKTGLRVTPLGASRLRIEKFITDRYSAGLAQEVTNALREAEPDETKTVDIGKLSEVISEAPIARIVKELLGFAVKSRASDIHIEPEERETRVRYRIDGILAEKFTMPRKFHEALVSRIKILGGMKIDEKRVPQDGRFNFKAGADEVDLRVSSLPTIYGEKVVMRLLKKSGGVPDLPDLGLRGRALKNLEDAILRPHGIILVTGPTGSGKTTTLYSVLSRINTSKVNIVTLEDPVEYKIKGVNQVQVNPDAGLTFASGLRSFLRQDPNIIMVGEIRDSETAALAIQAALTGHLVFSTLHTNDAAGAIPRLIDMGAEPFLLASTITTVLAQRVVRRIHEACKEEYKPEAAVAEDIKNILGGLWKEQDLKLYRGRGDAEDGNTGYLGRIGIYEVMPITEKIAKLMVAHPSGSDIQKAAEEEGMLTMKQDGYLKVLDGLTTIEEILRVAQE